MTAPALPAFFRPLRFATIGSTNGEAKRLAAGGAAEGTLVWAGEQTSGRGRRGRAWDSPPGNLYVSLVLRPACAPAAAAQLGFAAALAIGEAARPRLPPAVDLRYKWPNDVLIDGRKMSGILLESEADAAGRLAWLVVGIGVNLRSHPETAEWPATSLAAAGAGTIAPEWMLEAVAARMLHWYRCWQEDGFAPLRQAWLETVHGLGRPLVVRLAGAELAGRFADLDHDGALLLETAAGIRRVAAGEIFPAGAR